jgi:hypothetical protein
VNNVRGDTSVPLSGQPAASSLQVTRDVTGGGEESIYKEERVCAGRRRLAPVRPVAVLGERRLASGLADEKQHNSGSNNSDRASGRPASTRRSGWPWCSQSNLRENSSVDASRLGRVIGLARAQWIQDCFPPSARWLVHVEKVFNSFSPLNRLTAISPYHIIVITRWSG